jgi:hypothetical protein
MRIVPLLLLLSRMLLAADPFVGTWDLDIAKSRTDDPQVLKRVEMTFREQDGGLAWEAVQYFVDGRVRKLTDLLLFDQMEHPTPNIPGAKIIVRRLDATMLERVYRLNGKIISVAIEALLPDRNTVLEFVHVFKPDGSLLSDETQVWHRR